MALLSVIRRWALRDGLSIREIVRRTGLSRNTIRKYLRAGTVEPAFAPPTGLALLEEPKADVGRYDGLRGRAHRVRHAS